MQVAGTFNREDRSEVGQDRLLQKKLLIGKDETCRKEILGTTFMLARNSHKMEKGRRLASLCSYHRCRRYAFAV